MGAQSIFGSRPTPGALWSTGAGSSHSLTSNIPTSKGCGSSTTDILATVRLLLLACKRSLPEEAIARFIVEVEEASDGSVFSRPALFRHREGVVEEYLPGCFPAMRVIVIDTQPTRTINTIALPRAYYSEQELRRFRALVGRLKSAFMSNSAPEIGAIATDSARISQDFLPKPCLETLITLIREEQGYGLSVSHSGTVACALLPLHIKAGRCACIRSCCEALGMRILTEYALGGNTKRGQAA